MKLFVTAITIILSVFLAQAKNSKSDTSDIKPSEKVVLVTGFEAFDGEGVNPSYQAVTKLPDNIDSYKIIKKELPVSFKQSTKALDKYINKYNPSIILNVGQAGGRSSISLERVAINVDDARIPDNDGAKPVNKVISKKGENAYFSKLPIYKIKKAINAKGIPVIISNSAGTYVCNHIMYELLNQLANKYPNKIGGFIHVPYSTQQAVSKDNEPSMSIVDMTTAIDTAIKVSIKSLSNNG
ncbi:pyroglutamyl-peptidase I [Francisella adeliensis]|uniref:Pyroglutamyl-peptidase I n=1 Tax=Francisella adeliensis TaxID=2007306 RepID=A0A2Z4Y0S1_9GAMM|nr:pyroglutamyl-peptidase I [Francisella adeliensis]AXA34478.1 pyroglutamyl-peptidase I [Francisella adeliensis]MBK2086197.1 pyroglutamyl-peptidase I [Francisella adeliensis]MBK2096414.1 pyroglutamyl-peptidase I [Francisella adeliensis]QIW12725.1 pyroglutamyl-peptidase I [Francisella adeliensis]QIW14601.1 pyroglutamyl-peptidase I [Francisella adeliensis]